ncbi:hypothetical protein D3C76_103010 [compost metagenome]
MAHTYTVVAGGIPACADIKLDGVVIADAIYITTDKAEFYSQKHEGPLPAKVTAAVMEHFAETFGKGHAWLCANYDSTVKRTVVKTVEV